MATLARDSSSDSDSDSDSDSGSDSSSNSDVTYVPSDPYADVREALNAPMTVVDYDSEDERRQAMQRRDTEARAAEAAAEYRDKHAPTDTSSDDDAVTENDADTEIDDDVEMAVVSLKY